MLTAEHRISSGTCVDVVLSEGSCKKRESAKQVSTKTTGFQQIKGGSFVGDPSEWWHPIKQQNKGTLKKRHTHKGCKQAAHLLDGNETEMGAIPRSGRVSSSNPRKRSKETCDPPNHSRFGSQFLERDRFVPTWSRFCGAGSPASLPENLKVSLPTPSSETNDLRLAALAREQHAALGLVHLDRLFDVRFDFELGLELSGVLPIVLDHHLEETSG